MTFKSLGFAFISFTLSAFGADVSYLYNVGTDVDKWRIMFPAEISGKIFRNALTAVAIDTVKCDNVILQPRLGYPAHNPDLETVESGSTSVGYQMTAGFLSSWAGLTKIDGGFLMKTFELPRKLKRLEIQYSVRMPDGRTSGKARIVLQVSEDYVHVLVTK